jgi:hypothetical protein
MIESPKVTVVIDAALLQQVSPVAWRHLNLCRRSEFSKQPEAINMMNAVIQELAQVPVSPELDLTASSEAMAARFPPQARERSPLNAWDTPDGHEKHC